MPVPGILHDRLVLRRRVARLADLLEDALPDCRTVLDVGCGDGQISAGVAARRRGISVQGIDVLVRPRTAIPVSPFDGSRIPFDDDEFDVVMLVDVLHHAASPTDLLAEAARVAAGAVLVKDHCRDGILAGLTLRAMDWAGNAHHGVHLPHNYLTRAQWEAACRALDLEVASWRDELGLYPQPLRPLFERKLHFIGVLIPPVSVERGARAGDAGERPITP